MEHRQWVSRYREEIKGLAILWIVFFHTRLYLPGGFDLLRALGYGGVDIFLFIMGMGLHRSLSRQPELGGYLGRRFARILPAYLPVLLVWMAVSYPAAGLSPVQTLRSVAGNLTMVGYWFDAPHVYNWYANAQFLYFLIAPVFFAVLVRAKKPLWALCGLLALCVGIGVALIGQPQMMGIARLPILLLGMAFGMDWPASTRRGLTRAAYIGGVAIGLAAVVWCYQHSPILCNDFGMYWYPFALIAPALCVGLAYAFHKAEKARPLFAPLRLLGESSFEIYLVNIWLYEAAKQWQLTDVWGWLGIMAASLLLGVLYHLLVAACTRAWKARHGTPATRAGV